MRRIVLSLFVLSAVALSACGGGGSVLNFDNSSKPDKVILTVVGPTNIARVLPGGSLPISAVAVRGAQNGYVNANRFKWSAALITSGTYVATADGSTKACGNITITPTGGTAFQLVAELSIYITIDPTNESNILFSPPPIFPLPTTIAPPAGPGGTVTTNYPYCVIVSATSLDNPAAVGSITVAVVNPQSPTQ